MFGVDRTWPIAHPFTIPPREPAALMIDLRPITDRGAHRLATQSYDSAENRIRHHECKEGVVRRHTYSESDHTVSGTQLPGDGTLGNSGLPNRLMTAFEVAEFVGCHEETVRRAYLRGLLVSQRFGVRSRRFHPRDVQDWIGRGAPTRVS
jgi:excisionase family DNA binding protein